MNFVIDANAIFSILIKKGKNAEILMSPLFNFYAPEFLLEELEKYKEYITLKTKRTEENFQEIMTIIEEVINIILKEEFDNLMMHAKKISPDIKDAAYLALAMMLNCPIWSNDKNLKKQDKIKIFSTEELTQKFLSGCPQT
jgi:predicted nucleic acid-binding protein